MRKLIVVVAAGVLAVTALVAPALATFKGSNGRLLYQVIVGEHEQLCTVKPDGIDVRQLTDMAVESFGWLYSKYEDRSLRARRRLRGSRTPGSTGRSIAE